MGWFTYSETLVNGPFDSDEIKQQAGRHKGGLFWRKGLVQWVDSKQCIELLKKESNILPIHPKTPNAGSLEWHIARDGQSHGPFSHDELLFELKGTNLSEVKLWHSGLNEWTSAGYFEHLMNELGYAKRKSLRAKLQGRLTIETKQDTYSLEIIDISSEGISATGSLNLPMGHEFSGRIDSVQLKESVTAKFKITRKNKRNLVFEFSQLSSESQVHIVDFISKFHRQESKSAA